MSTPKKERIGRKILISVDGSVHSARAFEWYAVNMWQAKDKIIIFHISQPPILPTISMTLPIAAVPMEEWKTIMEMRMGEINKIEEAFTAQAIQMKMNHKFVETCMNNPGEGIVAYSKAKNIDMIVMGCRGLGTIRRTFLGSVSDYVLHHSARPVSVVPPPAAYNIND